MMMANIIRCYEIVIACGAVVNLPRLRVVSQFEIFKIESHDFSELLSLIRKC